MIARSTPIGAAVIVELADGRERATTTRTKPWPLDADRWVVGVHAVPHWFRLERVRVADAEASVG